MKTYSFFLNQRLSLLVLSAIVISALSAAIVDHLSFREEARKTSSLFATLIVEGDSLSIQSLMDNLQRETGRQLELRTFDSQIIRTQMVDSQRCYQHYREDLFNLGQKVGDLRACVAGSFILVRSLSSKFFFLTFSLIQLFGLFYLVMSKSATEKNLLYLIKNLEERQSQTSRKHEYKGKKSELFGKIEELIYSREAAQVDALEMKLVLEKEKTVSSIAKQVAHDIRSPLTALEIALRDTSGLAEGQRQLLKQASHRIKTIAEDLLLKSRQSKSDVQFVMPEMSFVPEAKSQSTFDLSESIIRIVREKNTVVSSFEIATSGLEEILVVTGEKNDFERSLSNLIQNSIEALDGRDGPSLLVAVRKYSSQVQVIVADNGKGIPSEVLSRIGEEGFSFEKANGNGLGVSSAKRKIREWGGDLHVTSKVGQGTMITATLQVVNE